MTKNTFLNYAFILITTIILSLASVLPLGVFAFLISAVLASVIGYTVTRYHYYFVGVVCLCVILVFSLFSGNFLISLTAVLPVLLCGISLGISYNVKLSEFKTISILAVVYIINLLLNLRISGVINQKSFDDVLFSSKELYVDVLTSAYGNEIPLQEIESIVSNVFSVMLKFMPSMLIVLCILIALLFFSIFKKVLNITKSDTKEYKCFSDFRADKSISIVCILVTVLTFIFPQKGYFSDVLANVCVISLFIFYIFGLSFASFLLKRKFKNPKTHRIIVVCLAILPAFSMGLPFFLIAILGILDGIFNLREKKKQ